MVLKDIVLAVLTALLGGGIGAAVVAAWNERWKLKFQRQAAKEDREIDKADPAGPCSLARTGVY